MPHDASLDGSLQATPVQEAVTSRQFAGDLFCGALINHRLEKRALYLCWSHRYLAGTQRRFRCGIFRRCAFVCSLFSASCCWSQTIQDTLFAEVEANRVHGGSKGAVMDSFEQVYMPFLCSRPFMQLTSNCESQGNIPAASHSEPQVYQQLAGALAVNAPPRPSLYSQSAKQSAR